MNPASFPPQDWRFESTLFPTPPGNTFAEQKHDTPQMFSNTGKKVWYPNNGWKTCRSATTTPTGPLEAWKGVQPTLQQVAKWENDLNQSGKEDHPNTEIMKGDKTVLVFLWTEKRLPKEIWKSNFRQNMDNRKTEVGKK